MSDDFNILVAKCGKTIGLKGQVKLIIYTDFLNIFKKGNIFKCRNSFLSIDSFNKFQSSAKFMEINDIDNAKLINGEFLYTTKKFTLKYCKLSKDEFFWFDIIGLNVYENDLLLGFVRDIEEISGIKYLVVTTNEKLINKAKTFMIPYISRYIIKPDLKTKCLYTKDTFGILEES